MADESQESGFGCDICGEPCRTAAVLRMHKNRKHGIAPQTAPQANTIAAATNTTAQASALPVSEKQVEAVIAKIDNLLSEDAASEKANRFNGLIKSLYDVEVKLTDVQADANSPLYSAQTFEELGLSLELLKGVYAMGFNRPSKIQEKALPLLIRDDSTGRPRNIVAQSQSGTGKTAAFVLSMLSRIKESIQQPQGMCIAPTRELARQIGDVVTAMAKFTHIRVYYAVKEEDRSASSNLISEQVIVGTAGTIFRLLQKQSLKADALSFFVVDEADSIIEQQNQIDQVMRIRKFIPPACQIALFSATFKPEVRKFTTALVPNANILSLKREELTVDAIQQFFIQVNSENDKFALLSRLYTLLTVASSIVFCEKIETAERLARQMNTEGYSVSLLHGQLDTVQRDKVMEDFRKGKSKVLISTNVLARGIDVLQISLVINFDLPESFETFEVQGANGKTEQVSKRTGKPDYETYLHRIGRTGRFGRVGSAINIISDQKSYNWLKDIEKFFNKPITELPADEESLESLLKEINDLEKD